MSKKLNNSVITVLVLLSVFCVLVSLSDMVSAHTVAINTPASDGVISGGAFNFTATVTYATNTNETIHNCTWYYSIDTGATWVSLYSMLNYTDNQTEYWNVTDTARWTDIQSAFQIKINCYNVTNAVDNDLSCSDINTGISVDNLGPSIGAITIEGGENKIRYITNPVKVGCISGDTGGASETAITLTKPGGEIIKKIVTSSDGWEYEFKYSDTNEAGLYLVDCMVSAPYGENRSVSASQKTFRMLYEDTFVSEEDAVAEPIAKLDVSTKDENTGIIVGKQGETKTFTTDGTTAHDIEFIEVTFTSVTLEIRSDPVTITLDVGQYKNVDVDGDGTDDIKVTLTEMDGDAAKIEVINLEKLAEKQREDRGVEEEIVEEAASSSAGLWITILVILIVIGVGYYLLKGKKGKKGQVKFSKQDLGL